MVQVYYWLLEHSSKGNATVALLEKVRDYQRQGLFMCSLSNVYIIDLYLISYGFEALKYLFYCTVFMFVVIMLIDCEIALKKVPLSPGSEA